MTLLYALASILPAQTIAPVKISVDVSKTTTQVSPSLYGIFFEEINQAGDGGIYAELLRNRGFEGGQGTELPVGWRPLGTSSLGSVTMDAGVVPNEARRHSLKIERTSATGRFGAINDGFWGVPVKDGERYRLTLWVKGDVPFEAGLEGQTGQDLGKARFEATGNGWKRIEGVFLARGTALKGRLAIVPTKPGTLYVGFASLMPVKTWKGRPNGMRLDLAQRVDAMKPAFVRFPGGCYVEGGDRLADAFDWKDSVQPLEKRKGLEHSMWGYSNTFGLGYHEYLQWCEDLGAEPMFVINCGMSHREITPMAEMDKWVTSAMEAIEYATGPVTSKWGAVRAKNGHPKPFKLTYIEIGNENGYTWSYGGQAPYYERYKYIHDRLKKAHPELKYIANVPVPHPTDLVDEHYYMSPKWFWDNKNRYDDYDRKGPKIYVGEYAVTQGAGTGNLASALGEAAFMTGMERNADIVALSSYAPLFVNINNRQWNPNAIVFDNHQTYGTPSYWVQALFANHRADVNVWSKQDKEPVSEPQPLGGTIGLQTWATAAEFKDITLEVDGKNVPVGDLDVRRGKWEKKDGVIRQTSLEEDRVAFFKGIDTTKAKKYVYRLKARKLEGKEGFIVMFDVRDENNKSQFNLGGWGNERSTFQVGSGEVGRSVPLKVDTGRWYDIRIEREGNTMSAFVDDKPALSTQLTGHVDFTSLAGIDKKKKELVIKAVNGGSVARTADLDITGGKLGKVAQVITLAGTGNDAENSFATPEGISPKSSRFAVPSGRVQYTFAPYSVTIIRIPLAGKK